MKPEQDYTELASQITEYSKNASKLLEDHKFEEAKSDFEEAYRISKLIRDPFTIRKCAFNLGAVYIRLCQARKGIEYLELAIPPDSLEDTFTNNGDLYFNIGLGYEMLKDYQNADSFFKKALKDYRHFQENKNDRMIEETLEKLAKNSRYLRNYLESADWSSELCQIYFLKGQEEKRIVTIGEQIVQLRKANEKEKCLILCNQIVCKIDEVMISPLTANMLNDVGLVLSQYERLNEAEKCYKKALSMVSALSSTEKLTAIILQNLGALYNITGQYHNSIDYHTQAAAKFSQLKNGINEGHCYANMGYAYNQVGNLDKAKEYFLLALRKAKDNGDPHAEWQVLESLGSICCNLGNHDVAIKYYTDAFKAITKDSTSQTSLAEDRIQAKLFTLMKQQSEKQESTLKQQVDAENMQEQQIMMLKQQLQQQAAINSKLQQHQYDNSLTLPRQPVHINSHVNMRQPHVEHTVTEVKTTKAVVGEPEQDSSLSTVQSAPELIHSEVKHSRKELIKRRLKVRRSGSQREFDKVARGVYVSMGADVLDSLIKEEKGSVHSSDFQFTDPGSDSDTTISSLSSNSLDDPKSPQKRKKSIFKMIKEKAEEKLKLLEINLKGKVEEDPKRHNLHLARRQSEDKEGKLLNHSILIMEDEREQVKEAMRAHLQEDDDENSQEETARKKKYTKKSLPAQSLSSSSSSTSISTSGSSVTTSSSGETTSDSETEKIKPQQKKSGPPSLPLKSPPQTLVNTYEKPADDPHYTEIEFNTSKAKPGLQSTSLSETMYETIQPPSSIDKLPPQTVNSPSQSDLSQMSRAERERFLYEQHLKSQHSVELPEGKGEKSKVCAIM